MTIVDYDSASVHFVFTFNLCMLTSNTHSQQVSYFDNKPTTCMRMKTKVFRPPRLALIWILSFLSSIALVEAVYSTHSEQYRKLKIVPENAVPTICNPVDSTYESCFTLQQFAKRAASAEYFQSNLTLTFVPGKHYLVGGVQLNNTANIALHGLPSNESKPEISCREKSCFTFHNTSSIHIENLVFSECFSEDSNGGAVFISVAEVLNVTQCMFINNNIRKRGGAMLLHSIKSVHIRQSHFINNSAVCHPADVIVLRYGYLICSPSCTAMSGAIHSVNTSLLEIFDSLFDGNVASCYCGNIYVFRSRVIVTNSTFVRNSVKAILGHGGGLRLDTSIARISDTLFKGNNADSGGGIYSSLLTLDILNCSFLQNHADFSGGAVYSSETTTSINGSIFNRNKAAIGGGVIVYAFWQNVIISQSIFQYNYKKYVIGGGAVHIQLIKMPSCTASCNSAETPNGSKPALHVVGSVFKKNKCALGAGGTIHTANRILLISKNEFVNNSAPQGGAISLISMNAYLWENKFTNNSATTGGAIDIGDSVLVSKRNTFSFNRGGSGGAISATKSTVVSNTDHYSYNTAVSEGGAIYAVIGVVTSASCTFLSNSAFLHNGGAVRVSQGIFNSSKCTYVANFASNNGGSLFLVRCQAKIEGDHFQHNSVRRDKGAAIFQTDNRLQLYNSTFIENRAKNTYTIQLTNVQGECNNLAFHRNVGSMYLFNSVVDFTRTITCANNIGIVGGALTLVQSTVSFAYNSQINFFNNSATYGGGIFLSQSELKVYTSLLRIDSNTAKVSGGGIHAYQSQILINVNETLDSVELTRNIADQSGGAIATVSSSLNIFQGYLFIADNEAKKGGGNFLSEGSKIYIQKNNEELLTENELSVKLTFLNNSAEYGGGIYVDDSTNSGVLCEKSQSDQVQQLSTEECFLQVLRLYYPQNFTFNYYNYMNIFFLFNKGRHFGNDIFGGLLDRCRLNALSELLNNRFGSPDFSGFNNLKVIAQFQIDIDYKEITRPFSTFLITNTITRHHVKGLISSEPVQLCFCKDDHHNCSYQWPKIFTKRGKAFSVWAVSVDQVENAVNGTVLATVPFDGARLTVGQAAQVTNRVCTELTYNVFSSRSRTTIQLFPNGPCSNLGISGKELNVTFLPCKCPNDFQQALLDDECRCDCHASLKPYITDCQLDENRLSVKVVRESNQVWIDYINDQNSSGFLVNECPNDYCVSEPVNLSISLPLNVNKQCAFNRSGIMCGECQEGLSLVFGSSRCVRCSNNYLALLIAFAVAGIALVVFILMLNLTVATATTNGLILYANILAANSSIFLPSETALRFFISWVNLDLGFEVCFYDGLDPNAKVLLQLVFPAYIILLAALIIVVSHYWGWFAGLIGRKNPVATLCMLFLLSYSKLLRTTIASLQLTYLAYPDGSSSILWLYNPNIQYFTPSRTHFFTIAIVIIIIGTVYTLLLFFGQWLRRKKLIRFFQSNKYNAFIDAYHAPFVFKHRYWIGILLCVRIIHHLSSSLLEESSHSLIVACLMCAVLVLKLLISKAYKNWLIDFLETSFFTNLLLLSVSTYYVTVTNRNQVALANTSVSIAFITFLGIVFFHTYKYILKDLKTYPKLAASFKTCLHHLKSKLSGSRANVSVQRDVDEASPSNLQLHLLREPVLDAVPISAQDYSPPVVPSASQPVTSTVVTFSNAICSSQED